MPSYTLCLYRYQGPFPSDVVPRVLEIVSRHLPRFFPVTLPVAPARGATVARVEDWDPSLVPAAFRIDEHTVRIPLYGADGTEISISDNRLPRVHPASVIITWRSAPLLATALPLMRELVSGLAAEQAHLTDVDTAISDEIYERGLAVDRARVPEALFWLTWLPPALVTELGPAALDALARHARIEPLAGGQLVILQDEPTADDASCAARRRAAEAALGLEALRQRFPFDPNAVARR